MSPQVFEFQVLRSLSLSFGVALLLGNASAIASVPQASLTPRTPSHAFSVSQANPSSLPPVVVDTDPGATGTSTTPTSTSGSSIPASESQARFSCQSLNGQYTVMYQPESQPNQSFPWATPSVLGDGWTAERRCNEISRRLESYRPDGLIELRTDVVNSYNTVCVTTQNNSSCRIVLTVPPGQDPMLTRDRVFQNLTTADSGQQTQAVNAYVNRGGQTNEIDQLFNMGRAVLNGGKNRPVASNNIQLRPFLDRADGGTGTRLQGGVPKQTNNRLNPNKFR